MRENTLRFVIYCLLWWQIGTRTIFFSQLMTGRLELRNYKILTGVDFERSVVRLVRKIERIYFSLRKKKKKDKRGHFGKLGEGVCS